MRSARTGKYHCIAALVVFLGFGGLGSTAAQAETRTISFHHIHTGEDLTVTYKVNGRYDDEALNKINHLLRDWGEAEEDQVGQQVTDRLEEVRGTRARKQAFCIL